LNSLRNLEATGNKARLRLLNVDACTHNVAITQLEAYRVYKNEKFVHSETVNSHALKIYWDLGTL